MHMTVAPSPPRVGPVRSPLLVWLLTLATCGVFGVVHHYNLNRELREFGIDVRPLLSVLAVVPGSVLIVPPLVTAWRTGDRISIAQETIGTHPTARGEISTLATIALLAVAPYHQREANRVWRAASAPGEGAR